jgi:hypothetical protein
MVGENRLLRFHLYGCRTSLHSDEFMLGSIVILVPATGMGIGRRATAEFIQPRFGICRVVLPMAFAVDDEAAGDCVAEFS